MDKTVAKEKIFFDCSEPGGTRRKLLIISLRFIKVIRGRKIKVALPLTILTFYHAPAFAYIDPNTGGFIFQLLAPIFAIAMSIWLFFAEKVSAIWRKLLCWFRSSSTKQKK